MHPESSNIVNYPKIFVTAVSRPCPLLKGRWPGYGYCRDINAVISLK